MVLLPAALPPASSGEKGMPSMETEPERRRNEVVACFGGDVRRSGGRVGILAVGGVLLAAAFAAYRAHMDTKKKGKEPEATTTTKADLPREEISRVEDAGLASIDEELESVDETAGFVEDPLPTPTAEVAEGRDAGSRAVSVLWIGGSITAAQVEECKLMEIDFSTIFPTPATTTELAAKDHTTAIEEDGAGDKDGAHEREGVHGGGSDGHEGEENGTCGGEEEGGGSFCAVGRQESEEEINNPEAEVVDVHVDVHGDEMEYSPVYKEDDGEEGEEESEKSDGTTTAVVSSSSFEPASASVWPAETMIGREMEMKVQLDLIHKAAISIAGYAKAAKAEYEIEEEEEDNEEEDEEEEEEVEEVEVKVPLSRVQVYHSRGIIQLVMVLAIVLGVFSAHYNGDLLPKMSYHIGQLVFPQDTKSA